MLRPPPPNPIHHESGDLPWGVILHRSLGMGLESATDDDDGDEQGRSAATSSAVPCSICLDAVRDEGDRSTARLQCGHQFHLDCIGSAFNAKGLMQCPNCRKIEKGNWLYAGGHFSLPEFNIDEWLRDEELYDLNLFEMPYGLQWCPFSRLARITSSTGDAELSPAMSFHDLLGHNAALTEHPANSSVTHCPYVGYFRTTQPSSSSSSSQVRTESNFEGSSMYHRWSNPSGSVDMSNLNGFLAVDRASSSWDSSSGSGRGFHSTEQTSVPSSTRATRINSDVHRRLPHPSVFLHGLPPRSNAPATTSVVSPHIRNPHRPHGHEIQSLPQHHAMPGHFSSTWRSGNARIPSSSGSARSQSHHAGAYHFTPAASRAPQESAARGGSQFYAWERDRFGPFPVLPVERESHWWVLPSQSNGSSDQSRQAGGGYWPQHVPEMSSSPSQPPQMHPFI